MDIEWSPWSLSSKPKDKKVKPLVHENIDVTNNVWSASTNIEDINAWNIQVSNDDLKENNDDEEDEEDDDDNYGYSMLDDSKVNTNEEALTWYDLTDRAELSIQMNREKEDTFTESTFNNYDKESITEKDRNKNSNTNKSETNFITDKVVDVEIPDTGKKGDTTPNFSSHEESDFRNEDTPKHEEIDTYDENEDFSDFQEPEERRLEDESKSEIEQNKVEVKSETDRTLKFPIPLPDLLSKLFPCANDDHEFEHLKHELDPTDSLLNIGKSRKILNEISRPTRQFLLPDSPHNLLRMYSTEISKECILIVKSWRESKDKDAIDISFSWATNDDKHPLPLSPIMHSPSSAKSYRFPTDKNHNHTRSSSTTSITSKSPLPIAVKLPQQKNSTVPNVLKLSHPLKQLKTSGHKPKSLQEALALASPSSLHSHSGSFSHSHSLSMSSISSQARSIIDLNEETYKTITTTTDSEEIESISITVPATPTTTVNSSDINTDNIQKNITIENKKLNSDLHKIDTNVQNSNDIMNNEISNNQEPKNKSITTTPLSPAPSLTLDISKIIQPPVNTIPNSKSINNKESNVTLNSLSSPMFSKLSLNNDFKSLIDSHISNSNFGSSSSLKSLSFTNNINNNKNEFGKKSKSFSSTIDFDLNDEKKQSPKDEEEEENNWGDFESGSESLSDNQTQNQSSSLSSPVTALNNNVYHNNGTLFDAKNLSFSSPPMSPQVNYNQIKTQTSGQQHSRNNSIISNSSNSINALSPRLNSFNILPTKPNKTQSLTQVVYKKPDSVSNNINVTNNKLGLRREAPVKQEQSKPMTSSNINNNRLSLSLSSSNSNNDNFNNKNNGIGTIDDDYDDDDDFGSFQTVSIPSSEPHEKIKPLMNVSAISQIKPKSFPGNININIKPLTPSPLRSMTPPIPSNSSPASSLSLPNYNINMNSNPILPITKSIPKPNNISHSSSIASTVPLKQFSQKNNRLQYKNESLVDSTHFGPLKLRKTKPTLKEDEIINKEIVNKPITENQLRSIINGNTNDKQQYVNSNSWDFSIFDNPNQTLKPTPAVKKSFRNSMIEMPSPKKSGPSISSNSNSTSRTYIGHNRSKSSISSVNSNSSVYKLGPLQLDQKTKFEKENDLINKIIEKLPNFEFML